jgi:DNA polymerase III delta prime subunit
VDTFRQFRTPVYAVFSRRDLALSTSPGDIQEIIALLLSKNKTLRRYLRDRLNSVREIANVSMNEPDEGMNLAIFNAEGPLLEDHQMEVLRMSYQSEKLSQFHMRYDQLVYPLIFWNGSGGCGIHESEKLQGSTTLIRKVLISLILQPRDHFIHQLTTLREEFICAVSGRLINLTITFRSRAQRRCFAREDEIRGENSDNCPKEYGLRTFIPPSLTDSDEYWHHVTTKCFALSTQLGPPTFFLTFTMNPYWADYQSLKRGRETFADSAMTAIIFKSKLSALMKFIQDHQILGNISAFVWRIEYQQRGLPHAHILFWSDFDTQDIPAVEAVINVRYPRDSQFLEQKERVTDCRKLIDSYQIHHHSKRCRLPDGKCRFGYPQPSLDVTKIRHHRYHFARDAQEANIVPHNTLLLTYFRCHHCLEVIHSEQCIGYVLKYCSKNSDSGRISLQNVLYEGHSVTRVEKLQDYAATRISSASECFAGICGYWRHHMKPSVRILGIHLPGQKIVLTSGPGDSRDKIDIPSPLERYFGRPKDCRYDELTYLEYHSRYSVDDCPTSEYAFPDVCEPVRFSNERKKPVLCIINSVHPKNHELFALRLLLRRFPARSWADLRNHNGETCETFYDAARQLGLVMNQDQEAHTCLQDAVELRRPPNDIRFLLVQMVNYGASRETLESRFWSQLADEGDTIDCVHRKINALLHPERSRCWDRPEENEMPLTSPVDEPLSVLTSEQHCVAAQIIDSVIHQTNQLMFLQGSAGTGKTFTIKALIRKLQSLGKRCLICGTTGIAAAQYPGGTTLHSLFRLGIDEEFAGSFRSNIGRDTFEAKYILEADLIIIDEVSMLTPWVANRVSMTLQSISVQDQMPFGGKMILFVGDLLQLPPVVRNFSMPVVYRLITRLPCWPLIRKFQLEQPMRSPDASWTDFLRTIAKGQTHEIRDWMGLRERFGVTVTDNVELALSFFCSGLRSDDPFPLHRQWICATNKLVNQINDRLQQWRSEKARLFGVVSALTQLIKPLPDCPGPSESQQLDSIERIDTPELPPNDLRILDGDPFVLLRNIETYSGLGKGRRCHVVQMRNRTVVVQLDNNETRTLTRIPMEKRSNSVKFV